MCFVIDLAIRIFLRKLKKVTNFSNLSWFSITNKKITQQIKLSTFVIFQDKGSILKQKHNSYITYYYHKKFLWWCTLLGDHLFPLTFWMGVKKNPLSCLLHLQIIETYLFIHFSNFCCNDSLLFWVGDQVCHHLEDIYNTFITLVKLVGWAS